MPAVSLLWNTNVAVMTCENNFPLRVGVAACGGSHSEGWQGYALLSAASLDSTSLMGTSPPPPPLPLILIYVDEFDVLVSSKS